MWTFQSYAHFCWPLAFCSFCFWTDMVKGRRRQLLPNRFVCFAPPHLYFLQPAIGCASVSASTFTSTSASLPWPNDWGLILSVFFAFDFGSFGAVYWKGDTTVAAAMWQCGSGSGNGRTLTKFCPCAAGKLCVCFIQFFFRSVYLRVPARYYRRETYVNMSFDTFVSWLKVCRAVWAVWAV